MSKRVFVTGNGTDIGKTIACAVLAEAWHADYWKPVQCGNLEKSDTMLVQSVLSNPVSRIHPEAYRFQAAISPHAAAAAEHAAINLQQISPPHTDNALLIEGAGGVLVPLNAQECVIDLIPALAAQTIVVSRNYLGSINHTLLTIEALQVRDLPILGIIFNGPHTPASEEIILKRTGVRYLGRLEHFIELNKNTIVQAAVKFKEVP